MRFVNKMLACFLLSGAAVSAHGDWIVLNKTTFRDVYVREGRTAYFVHFPETGEVRNVPKSSVLPRELGLDTDPAARERLLTQWRVKNPLCKKDRDSRNDVRQHLDKAQLFAAATQAANSSTSPSFGSTASGNLGGGWSVGVPHAPSTVYRQSGGQARFSATPAPRTTSASGAAAPNPGMGRVPARNPGYGAPVPGGYSGMAGTGMRDVAAMSNISDLFFNIDDRLVGESPAEILPGYRSVRR